MLVNQHILSGVSKGTLPFDIRRASTQMAQYRCLDELVVSSGVWLSPDGHNIFLSNLFTKEVGSYSLPIAHDLRSLEFVSTTGSLVTYFSHGNIKSVVFNPDGTKMFVKGDNLAKDTIGEFTLSTPWDVTTYVFDHYIADQAAYNVDLRDFKFSSDGSVIYIYSDTGLLSYPLSTSWDISTLGSLIYDHDFVEDVSHGIFFNSDESVLFALGGSPSKIIHQYDLSTPGDLSTISLDSSTAIDLHDFESYLELFYISPEGDKIFIPMLDHVHQKDLTTPWDFAGGTTEPPAGIFHTGVLPDAPYSIQVSADGTKLYVSGTAADIYQYTLSTAWDLSTATYDSKSYSITATSSIYGFTLNAAGTKMLAISVLGDSLYEHTLSTPWDISTASYDSVYTVVSEDANPRSFIFNDDGTELFFVGITSQKIYQYSLATPWTIADGYTPVGEVFDIGQSTGYIAFADSGNSLLHMSFFDKIVYQYDLSTPYDISTAVDSNKELSVVLEGKSLYSLITTDDHFYMADPQYAAIIQFSF